MLHLSHVPILYSLSDDIVSLSSHSPPLPLSSSPPLLSQSLSLSFFFLSLPLLVPSLLPTLYSAVLLLFHLLMYCKHPPKSRSLSKRCLAICLLRLSQLNLSIIDSTLFMASECALRMRSQLSNNQGTALSRALQLVTFVYG